LQFIENVEYDATDCAIECREVTGATGTSLSTLIYLDSLASNSNSIVHH